MAYDDSRFRSESAFRAEPGYDADSEARHATGAYSYAVDNEPSDATSRHAVNSVRLDDVFDDPTHGEPGRDRMAVHIAWELVLLVGAGVLGYLLYSGHRATVTGDGLDRLLIAATVLGLLILGTGLSLRAGVPNLAVGPIGFAASLFFADHADRGLLVTAAQTGLLAVAAGAVIAVFVVGLHVPAWAASLGAGLGVIVWSQSQHRTLTLPSGVYQPTDHALYWFGGFAVLAFLGGAFGSVRSIRRSVGRFRPVGDPAYRRGAGAGVIGIIALTGSSALGAVAGVLTVLAAGRIEPADQSLTALALSLGGALLAGTSAFGRRGGLFGAALAAALLALATTYIDATDRNISLLALGAAAIGVGLVGTRLVETFGRPRATFDQEIDHWRSVPATNGSTVPGATSDTGGWNGSRSTGWTSPLPASSADDRWGSDDTWRNR